MSLHKIDADQFRKMIQAASIKLNQDTKLINSLNVFPVPDGDTGTNMSMSMASGEKYVDADPSRSVGRLAAALAKGLLMGARGNSGVILSQIFRGFYKAVQNRHELDATDVTRAFKEGTEVAYKAVMKPTEGTILTVIRAAAQAGVDAHERTSDLRLIFDSIYSGALRALKHTPDLLPVLKKVGVVDSGGQGLVAVLQAFDGVLNGKTVRNSKGRLTTAEMNEMVDATHRQSAQSKLDPADIKYGYCTQMTVRFGRGKECDRRFQYRPFYNYLASLGNSLLVVNDSEVVKVHVHTEHPGKVLAWGQHFGDLTRVKVDNMRYQQEDIIHRDKKRRASKKQRLPSKKTAVISVVAGKGLRILFKSLGVTDFVNGGQTMNPSTQEILKVINHCNAKQAIILPNNGNVYMAAKVAAQNARLPTAIVKSKTINQGLAVMLGYNPNASLKQNHSDMTANLDEVKSGEVTYATRDTVVDHLHIRKHHYLGIVDGKITATASQLLTATVQMIKTMLDRDSEVVTIIYGQNASRAEAQIIERQVKKLNSDLETEVHSGGQPVYPFLISVE